MLTSPLFIVFEGIDGAGTTTQCQRLCDRLRVQGHQIVQTREPGGTPEGERLRELVLDPVHDGLDNVAELFLYAAARRQHVVALIRPSLAAGKPVISDRYADSTYAYQGVGRGLPEDLVETVNRMATDGLAADLTIYLDIGVETALARRRARDAGPGDRLEAAGCALQDAARGAYRQLAAACPERSLLIDAKAPADTVFETVYSTLIRRFPAFPMKTVTRTGTSS